MVYAFRESEHSRTLVEFKSEKEMAAYAASQAATDGGRQPFTWRRTTAERARDWVKRGNVHETGLWTDYDGRVRYAAAQYD